MINVMLFTLALSLLALGVGAEVSAVPAEIPPTSAFDVGCSAFNSY